jgi:hypothetical protein
MPLNSARTPLELWFIFKIVEGTKTDECAKYEIEVEKTATNFWLGPLSLSAHLSFFKKRGSGAQAHFNLKKTFRCSLTWLT